MTLGVLVCAFSSAAVSATIYSCTDSKGRKLTSDRPIAECTSKEQQILNRDASVRSVLPPTLTAQEKLARDNRERAENEARLARQDAIRRDRNLMQRYPDEAAHVRARESALNTVRASIKTSQSRLLELAQQRKPLLDEMEFYKGKALPVKLKMALDANDAASEAQKSVAINQAAELERINGLYDAELGRLRQLWAGVSPGDQSVMIVPASAVPNKSGR